MKSFKTYFFSLPRNPDDFGSFLPFRTHGRCFDRGVGKRQRPEVFSGRERPFLRCGSLLRQRSWDRLVYNADVEMLYHCTPRFCFILFRTVTVFFLSFSEGLFHLLPFRSTSTAVDWRSFKLNQQHCCERKFVRGWEIAAPTIHASKQFFGLFLSYGSI